MYHPDNGQRSYKPCSEVSSWNATVSEFSKLSLSDLQRDWSGRYYSNFQNFYVLPYIRFLSLIELERWLAEVMFVSSATLRLESGV